MGDDDEMLQERHEFESDALLHLEMMVIAGKYGQSDLLEVAGCNMGAALNRDPESFWAVLDKLDSLAENVRDAVNMELAGHASSCDCYEIYLQDPRFQRLMKDHREMAWEVVEAYQRSMNRARQLRRGS